MKILNLGCGSKVSSDNAVVNIDWSVILRIRSNSMLRWLAPMLLNADRLRRFKAIPSNVLVYDLSRGIPFDISSVDVVYSSHVLEHLDRDVAPKFITECFRVLKPNGTIRLVVPDFELIAREYIDDIYRCENYGDANIIHHDKYIEPLLLQSVRREASGTSQQKKFRRILENLLLGDARKRGETHQWMYDRFNLRALLTSNGFVNVSICSFNTSSIDFWNTFALDMDDFGFEYKPKSLYIEAKKP